MKLLKTILITLLVTLLALSLVTVQNINSRSRYNAPPFLTAVKMGYPLIYFYLVLSSIIGFLIGLIYTSNIGKKRKEIFYLLTSIFGVILISGIFMLFLRLLYKEYSGGGGYTYLSIIGLVPYAVIFFGLICIILSFFGRFEQPKQDRLLMLFFYAVVLLFIILNAYDFYSYYRLLH